MKNLMNHSWPGNVRELENLITSFCINAQGEVLTSSDFPTVDIREPDAVTDSGSRGSDFVTQMVNAFF